MHPKSKGIAVEKIQEAKKWLRAHLKEGARCPVCNQFAKMYERRLYSSMAAALIYLYCHFDHKNFIHKSELVKAKGLAGTFGGGDFAKLAYWGLIEEQEFTGDEDKRTSGYWRITPQGIRFVQRKIKVKSHVKIYDSRFFGFSGEDVSIEDCLGKKFSYSELMGLEDVK